MKRIFILISLILAIITVCGCAGTKSRGNIIHKSRISEIKNRVKFTKSDVLSFIGPPTTISTLSQNTWYYIFAKYRTHALFKDKIISSEIVSINFNNDGIVESINENQSYWKSLTINKDITNSSIKRSSAIRRFLKNIRKFKKENNSDKRHGI